MIMWIILGSLIAVVAIFLIFTGVMDRKKNKKIKFENQQLELMRQNASPLIAIWVKIVIDYNNHFLAIFKPSIGKFKMSDIRQAAKKSLQLLMQQKPYELIENSQDHVEIKNRLFELLQNGSNNWNKNHHETIDFFQKHAQEISEDEQNEIFKSKAQKIIKGVYDELTK